MKSYDAVKSILEDDSLDYPDPGTGTENFNRALFAAQKLRRSKARNARLEVIAYMWNSPTLTLADVAKTFGLTLSTIKRYASDARIVYPAEPKPKPKKFCDIIDAIRANPHRSYKEIAEDFQVSPTTVAKYAQMAGLPSVVGRRSPYHREVKSLYRYTDKFGAILQALYDHPERTYKEIAKDFQVSQFTVSKYANIGRPSHPRWYRDQCRRQARSKK